MERTDRLAEILIRNYGNDAPREAARRVDELRSKGDLRRCEIWQRVVRATEDLLDDMLEGKRFG